MRRAAILVTCLATLLFAGCNLYFDDDDRKNRPQSGDVDAGPCCGDLPDAGCGTDPGHPDAGFWPDAGVWPDGGFVPDASL